MRLILLGALLTAPCLFAVEEFPSSAGPIRITPIQHASLLVQAGGKVLYVDPAQGAYDNLPKADYILITDIHGDHLSAGVIDKLKTASTEIIGSKAVAEKLSGVVAIGNGESKKLGPFSVEAIAAYNLTRGPKPGSLFHDKGRGNGYVIGFGGKRIYFSGDTEGVPEMKALRNIDVAFVCMNLPYTMTPEEAAEAVKAFHPKVVYPYHYRGQDTGVFAKALAGTGIDVRLRDLYAK
jgi:L-ascorbate metabolism protein UlaG (beta-lactamase superfamily)